MFLLRGVYSATQPSTENTALLKRDEATISVSVLVERKITHCGDSIEIRGACVAVESEAGPFTQPRESGRGSSFME